jgi:hypothetical protein
MFKLNLGSTPHILSEQDIRSLGQRTEGYRYVASWWRKEICLKYQIHQIHFRPQWF